MSDLPPPPPPPGGYPPPTQPVPAPPPTQPFPTPPPTQPAPVAPGAYPPAGAPPPPPAGYPPPAAPGWGAGGGQPPGYGAPPPSGPSGAGGNKALLIVLAVLGGIVLLIVVAVLVSGALDDGNDAAVASSTTVSPTTAAPTTTTDGPKPGDSALDPTDTTAPADTTPPADTTTINVFDLAVGDCFDVPNDGNITNVDGIDCSDPHDNEVFATFEIAGGPDAPFPGAASISGQAQRRCTGELFTAYVGIDFQSSRFQATSINPTRETWESSLDDREVICVATSGDGSPLTQSVRGSNE